MENKEDDENDIKKYNELKLLPTTLAEILPSTDSNIRICSNYLLQGNIVGMPTETVYGLAANAFDVKACEKIFEYKNRPFNDPLIVHVCSIEMAKSITNLNSQDEKVFNILSKNFWPGPLTIILPANLNKISTKIIANGDTVGIRFPIHPIAKKLIEYCNVPIAAPSANKFCHISPVNPYHVFFDFKEYPIKILNGKKSKYSMESTVIKIENNKDNKKIKIFRMGAIGKEDIEKVLKKNDIYDFEVESIIKKINLNQKEIKELTEKSSNDITINQEAPGQFLKHYSPKLKTYIYSGNDVKEYVKEINLNSSILFIDYNKILFNLFINKNNITEENFIELSESDNPEECMKNFYECLHKAEKIKDKNIIVLCDLEKFMKENQHKLTLLDRMWKAASFKKCIIKEK
jgi:tRNA threonylcarbamoyl adenosine modification protein (Sua5/YciO/YrdC/YwlC family)